MWQAIKKACSHAIQTAKSLASRAWTIIKKMVPGLFLATVAIDAALLTCGNTVIVASTLSGIAAVLSITFILFGFTPETRKKVVRFLAKYGNYLDMTLTVLLTLIGFSVSVTMGLTALFIGVNVSGTMALLRFIDCWSR